MRPGSRWLYRETDPDGTKQRVVVTVAEQDEADRKRRHGPGRARRRDRARRPVEVTEDWYAQDACGNVWYLGEETKEYENGKVVSTKGSWEAGVDGAQPGVIMPASPRPGMRYRQEYYAGHAEDRAEILSRRSRSRCRSATSGGQGR